MSVRVLLALVTMTGTATVYGGAVDEGRHEGYLYCSSAKQRLHYKEETEPWVAVDVGWYERGEIRCGDLFTLYYQDGQVLHARAWDAGYLAGAITMKGEVVVDVPAKQATFDGLMNVRAVNVDAFYRLLRERKLERNVKGGE